METEKYYGTISIDQINLNDGNPRSIKKDKLEQLKKSIQDFPEMLELRPIILNENNIVLGGNMRVTALKELGYTEVPFIKVKDLTPQQQEEFIIKDNLSYGEWDWDMLEETWDQNLLIEWGLDIPDNKFYQKDEAEEDDYNGVVPPTSRIKIGDIIEIGPHRLMCGDSTDPDHVEILMKGELADLLLTDPPYGVTYDGVPAGKDLEVIENDDLRGDGLYIFLHEAFKNAYNHTKDNAAAYVWYADQNYNHFINSLKNNGYKERQKVIWIKGMVLNRSDYHFAHENCLYLSKNNGTGVGWYGGRDKQTIMNLKDRGEIKNLKKEDLIKIVEDLVSNTDTWEIRKDAVVTYVHPTQKPIPLSGKIINNSSPMKGLCLDLFLGSGSSMVAAHQLGRRLYGMELDPKYCEVIIDRMKHNDPELKVTINGTDY